MPNRKSVLITGCSPGGAGESMARAFVGRGLRVFATARTLFKIQHLGAEGIEILQLDVTDTVSLQQAAENVSTLTRGSLDYLISNAGGGYSIPLLDSNPDEVRALFDLNVFALVNLVQHFTPLLRRSKGTLVSIGSISGVAPIPWQGWYNSSKAAVNSLNNTLRLELAPFDIKVISVVAGGFESNFFDNNPGKVLPAASVYMPADTEVLKIMNGGDLRGKLMKVDVFANDVVTNALKKNPRLHLWTGTGGTLTWFLQTFGWSTIWDFLFKYAFQLGLATRKIKADLRDK